VVQPPVIRVGQRSVDAQIRQRQTLPVVERDVSEAAEPGQRLLVQQGVVLERDDEV